MAVIFLTRTGIRQVVAAVVLGVLLGFAGATLLSASEIDSLISANNRQKAQIDDLKKRLEAMEKSLESSRCAVKKLEVETNIKSERLGLRVEKQVKDLLSGLVGKELAVIDPLLTFKVLDNRKITIDKQDYMLKVKALLLAENTLVILDVISGRTKVEE